MRWFRKHNPNVHYRFWTILIAINLGMAGYCAWISNRYSISMSLEVIFFVVMSLLSYVMTRIWLHWIDNPDDYEKIYQARLRRLSGRDGRTRGEGDKKKKEDSKK